MISSRLVIAALATVSVGALSIHPADAAVHKKKPIHGAYDVSLPPDPTLEVTGVGAPVPQVTPVCEAVNPLSYNNHPFTVPGAGKLEVNLQGSSLPQADWDLYLLDSSGAVIAASHGPTATEAALVKFKSKDTVTIRVCNLIGDLSGHVDYTFTWK